MLQSIVGEARRTRDAVQNMAGAYRAKYVALSERRIAEFDLIDDWMRQKEAIFIHVPKAAGRSIFDALGAPIHPVAHVPAEAYRQADRDLYDRFYTFGFTRNPWDRLVSGFTFINSVDTKYNLAMRQSDFRRIDSFSTFLTRLRNPLYRNRILSRMHFMPQTHYLCDAQMNVIVDAVGRFENLPQSFEEITEKVPGVGRLKKKNCSPRAGYREYYPETWQVDLVGRMYKSDCEVFDYRFDG